VGSPAYFESHPKPKPPRDLLSHQCINFRHGSAGVYRWEFDKGKKSLSVAVNGPLIVDDVEIVIRAAIDGVAWHSYPRNTPRCISLVGHLYACWKIGASRSQVSSSTTRAGGSSQPHFRL